MASHSHNYMDIPFPSSPKGGWRGFLLSVVCCLLSDTALADKKNGKQIEPLYVLPEPDVLMAAPQPDRPLQPIGELRPLIRPSAGQQRGIDVSHYQGYIKWEQVGSARDISFVYIKATESSNLVDDFYLRNLAGAKRAGIPVGVYHFFRPNASAMAQFENFRSTVNPRQQDLIPIVDVEKRGKGSLAQFHGTLKAFLKLVERYFGVKPIIYTGVNFYAKYLEGKFTDYRFMVARYAEEFPGLSEDVPIVLWQYSCTGRVDGIKGHVDQSVFLDRYNITDIMLKTP